MGSAFNESLILNVINRMLNNSKWFPLVPAKKPKRQASKKQELTAEQASRMAEEAAFVALGSSLRIAAALGTVAAKTASLALASLASGADKFAELVKEEVAPPRARKHIEGKEENIVGRKRRSARALRAKTAS